MGLLFNYIGLLADFVLSKYGTADSCSNYQANQLKLYPILILLNYTFTEKNVPQK